MAIQHVLQMMANCSFGVLAHLDYGKGPNKR